MWPDIFTDDAFSLVTLTAVINNQDFVPGRAGELAFAGTAEGVNTTTVAIESIGGSLSLVQTSPRGGPAPQEQQDKGTLRSLSIPQVKLEDTITAAQLQNTRQLGSNNTLRGARTVIDGQIRKMNQRFDLTLEHHRLGALKGIILDADGSTLMNLFTEFGVSAPADVDFSDAFDSTSEGDLETLRGVAQRVTRTVKRNIKATWPGSARLHAFCGDNFFDGLIESTKGIYDGWSAAERRLGANYAHGVFEFAGILWENYQGTDDNTTVAINSNEAQFFVQGVPGLYAEYYAPGDFFESVNTIGLPRYAKIAQKDNFNRALGLHVQMNPLPLCLRPQTLVKGTWDAVPTGFGE